MKPSNTNWHHFYKYTMVYIALMVTLAVALLVKGTFFS